MSSVRPIPRTRGGGRRAATRKKLSNKQKAALADPLRKRLYRAIGQAPGLPLSRLIKHLDIGWSTLYCELDALEKAALVRSRKKGRHRLVFPTDDDGVVGVPLTKTVMLQGKTVREIATRIAKKPGQNMEMLSEHLDLSPRVVYYHLRRLVEGKLVKSSSSTRYRDLAPTAELERILKDLNERDRGVGRLAPIAA